MNESATSSTQSPADSDFSSAWTQASRELGIAIEAPFTLRTADGEFVFPALIREFGSPFGTLVLSGAIRGHDKRAFAAAQAAGYFVSVLADGYARYDRQSFIETLDDWQFFGAQPQPSWYSDTPWTS
ncbi:MAG TPA: hypothetical protein VF614_05270 [Chthoniobacteraceae bacterium]|jgi:hypothetical protein